MLIGRMAEEEVERDVAGGVCGGLLLDGEAAEHGGADALKGVIRNAGGGDFFDFREQFESGEVGLFRRGGEVEGEEACVIAEELGGADLIGEAEFLADADEQGAGHIGGVFLDHGESMALRAVDGCAGKADGEHSLFFGQADGEVRAEARCAGGDEPWVSGGQGG